MLNGASQIIGGVSGIHLDPLLLAQSQDGDGVGFIMVAHEAPQKSFDLLFIHGPAIVECARITPDSRYPTDVESVRTAFLTNRRTCLVHLFSCPVHEIERFTATLHAEPCLKVHVNAITRRQIRSLIKATGCRNGIIERNIFETNPPRIELVEFDPRGNFPALKTGLTTGRLLLYDLDKANDLRVRMPATSAKSSLRPRQRKGSILVTKQRFEATPPSEEPHEKGVKAIAPNDKPAENQIDEFDALIKQILSSPPSSSSQKDSPHSRRTKRKQTDQHEDSTRKADSEPVSSKTSKDNGSVPASNTNDDTSNTQTQEVPSKPESPKQMPTGDDGQKYVKIFQRLFRSFRQQAFECFGPRYETVMGQAEQQVRLLSPEFDMDNLTEDTVPLVLDIIEDMIGRAPFLKRSKLREAAQVLVADLYNKHYELLDQHNAIDKVEQNYFQLKK